MKRITLYNSNHMMGMTNVVAISVETLRMDSECSFKIEFTQSIHMNLLMVIMHSYQLV